MVNKKKLVYVALFVIILLSVSIRFYHLGTLPSNMQEDEVMTGYVGRYIIQNGVDLYGNKWPLLYFNKFGDFYIIGPIYLKGLATYLFGVNAFAVRFPTALLGGLTVIPVYLLASLLFQSASVGLLSAFTLAIMPWTIPLGRASSEGILGGFFFLFGIYYFLAGYRQQKIRPIIIGSIYILFTFWIYHNYRLLSSLFVLGYVALMFFEKKVNKKILITFVSVFVFFFLLTILISRTPWGRGRFDQTGILSPMSGVSTRTQELIMNEHNTLPFVTRIFHNKLVGYGREFIRQYSIYFSGEYLFIKGGKSEAYAVPEEGLLYLSFIIPLVFVIILLTDKQWIKKNKGNLLFLVYCVLISPIPSALTIIDAPNIQRSILLGLFLSISIGLGLNYMRETLKKYPHWLVVYMLILCIEVAMFWHNYTTHTDSFTSMYRNDGEKELITYLKDKKNGTVYLPTYGTMSMYYLFYMNDFSKSYAGTFKNDVKVGNIKNVVFIDSECPSQNVVSYIKKDDFVVDPITACTDNWQGNYMIDKRVIGVNEQLGFRVLKLRKE